MAEQEVKFGEWLGQGFDLFKENIVLLILASLIVQCLSLVTGLVLTGPMMAGMALITLKLVDKSDTPTVGMLFDGFSYFLESFLFVLVWSAITLGAYVFSLLTCTLITPLVSVAALVLGALLMFAPFLIVDRKMAFWPASMASMEIVKTNLWPLFGYFLVSAIIGSAGSLLFGIGAIVTMPIYWCMIAVAYRGLSNGSASVPSGSPETTPDPVLSDITEQS